MIQTTFTLVRFYFKAHHFCYGSVCRLRLHFSTFFDPWKQRLKKKPADHTLVYKLWGLKMMAWLPKFALHILDDSVNNYFMLIFVPASD